MKNVLICDDQVDIRDVVEMLFEIDINDDIDTTLHSANDGLEAIALLSKEIEFNLIICDMNMPNASGVDVYQFNQSHKNVPFILLSGDVESDIAKFEDHKTNEHFHAVKKPWQTNVFVELIKSELTSV
jgi:CheY-like chemotaxis protein